MAGIIASGVVSVAFTNLAISIALERDDGTVRRLATTPMPRSAYFAGKVVRVLVASALETALLHRALASACSACRCRRRPAAG